MESKGLIVIYTKSNVKKTNPIQTQFKANLTQTNPIQTQFQKRPKMNVNKVLTRDYEEKRSSRREENKPNQTQFAGCQKNVKK